MTRALAALAAAAALAACSGISLPAGPPTLHLLPDPPAPAETRPFTGAIAVSRVSLPEYADVSGIAAMDADGSVERSVEHLWADPPARAITIALARALADRTGAAALAEPWPLEFSPARRVDVIADRMIAGRDGSLRFSGEYRIADGGGLRTVRRFDLAVDAEGEGYPAIAAAHAEATARLADAIAADL
jgi:uncharacterized lipoprotein YmbA